MPQIMNSHFKQQIQLEIDLIKNDSFIYDCENKDYLNWLPIEFCFQVENERYIFKKSPTFSVEGLKVFLRTIETLLEEKKKKGMLPLHEAYEKFECGATEGEFHLRLENMRDDFEKDQVSIELWLNTAYMRDESVGYDQGFSFAVFSEDLSRFMKELKQQLYDLTDGNEGEKMEGT
ncbi:WapI family immunity protein [Candidatus Enterococcus clewellii]|uniref:Uncharacterized protein n=1 Tax=Candidatus Enterococcus clewellii TaxID=1834193 RepID=A0A242JYY1_9ENTE|nr:hypothetical protein A5888_003826 [Enterococcus sp. 9E7_DIV0242]